MIWEKLSAGTSYARIQTQEEVIAAGKRTCAPYWENGVLQVFKNFLLNLTLQQ